MTIDSPAAATRRTLAVWLATVLGIGLALPAPGTWGAVCGLAVAWGLAALTPGLAWSIVALLLLAGVPICTRAAHDLGGAKDPGAIIWDELATVPLVFLCVPLTSWWTALLGFALHRLFDITKPWLCHRLERLPDGIGIMADDVAAALYAALVLWALGYVGIA